MSDENYADRYCAFIDILGFSNLIRNIRRQEIPYKHVRDLLRKVHQPTKCPTHGVVMLDVRATSISDAIALSADFSAPGLAGLIDTISRLTLGVLEAGYFVRGGLCRGPLYHDKDMVFGEALVNAYNLEATIARYPRVMVSKQVYDEAMASNLKNYFGAHLKQSLDGPYYVDAMEELRIALKVMETNPADFTELGPQQLIRYEMMRYNIERRLAEAADNPNHFEKVQWFARYWNDGLGENRDVARVKGPGLNIVTWVNNNNDDD